MNGQLQECMIIEVNKRKIKMLILSKFISDLPSNERRLNIYNPLLPYGVVSDTKKFKMTVTYNGLDCLADKASDTYMTYKHKSQAANPWASNVFYGKVTVYFAVATIFVAFLKNIWFRYVDMRHNKNTTNFVESFVFVITAYCRHFGYMQTPIVLVELFSAPENLGQAIFASFSSGFLLCYCFVPHFWYRGCLGFGSPPLAIRAGIMSTALLPFIFSLSGKYSLISFLSGIGYEKLNWIHQFASVLSLALALVHTIPFIHQRLVEGGSSNLAVGFKDKAYWSGIAPLVFFILLCTCFKKQIRKVMYEVSFHFHWLMGCGFFASLTYHVYDELDMQDYMWATLAIWVSQWICRVMTSGLARTRSATMSKLSENLFEMTIDNVKGLKWKPGQHCFLRFPTLGVIDNHPFSIASILNDEQLRFVIMPRGGMTKKLHAQLEKPELKLKVFVDGPYGGTSRDFSKFDRVILMATGSGISSTLPYIKAIVGNDLSMQKVDLFWTVRHTDDFLWAKKELESIADLAGDRASICIFVVNELAEKKILAKTSLHPSISIFYERPNFGHLLKSLETTLLRRNLFVSCGSSSMRRTVNTVVSDFQANVISGTSTSHLIEEVYLHNEVFSW